MPLNTIVAHSRKHKCRARACGPNALNLADFAWGLIAAANGNNGSSSLPPAIAAAAAAAPAAIYSVAVHKTNFRYELLLQQQSHCV